MLLPEEKTPLTNEVAVSRLFEVSVRSLVSQADRSFAQDLTTTYVGVIGGIAVEAPRFSVTEYSRPIENPKPHHEIHPSSNESMQNDGHTPESAIATLAVFGPLVDTAQKATGTKMLATPEELAVVDALFLRAMDYYDLNDIERQITLLIMQGKSNGQIADELGLPITVSGMQGRIDGIYDKLGCKKRTQISTTLLFGAINSKAALPVEESEALVIADTVNSIPLRTEEEWIYGDELSPKEYHVLFESAQAQMILRGHHPSVAEIAALVAQNHTAKSIADTLLLSESTVNRRIRNLHQSNPRYPNKVAVVHHVVRTGMQKLIDASLQMHDPNLSGMQRRSSAIRILNERRAERMESFGFDTDDKKFTLAGIRGLTHAAMAKRLRVSHNQITYRQAKATAKACAKGRVGLIHRVYGVE